MIKAIIFDCFGVLVGTGYWSVYQRLGGDLTKDAAFLDDILGRMDTGKISHAEVAKIVTARLGITLEEYERAYKEDETPNLEVFDFIRGELKSKYKIGLLSNVGPGNIQRKIPPELLQLFDAMVLSGEVGLLKPDPAIFRLAVEKLGVKPEEALFTDDHVEYLAGATAIGMPTILFKNLEDFKRQLAAAV
jgi:HAD superfamily hydrolase (TIGR01509 family)